LSKLKYKELNPDPEKLRNEVGLGKMTHELHAKIIQIEESRISTTRNSIVGIMALSTFYEGFINQIGIDNFKDHYFEENLDKLNPISKWRVVLRLLFNEDIIPGESYYNNLRALFGKRNEIVHFKPKKTEPGKRLRSDNDIYKTLEDNFKVLPKFIVHLKEISKDILNIENLIALEMVLIKHKILIVK